MRAANRKEIEDRWRLRLTQAQANYRTSSAAFCLAADEYRKREIPSQDGHLRLSQALAAETRARGEYIRILKLFTDLIMYGRTPDDEEG
jgi:hypothetical protein